MAGPGKARVAPELGGPEQQRDGAAAPKGVRFSADVPAAKPVEQGAAAKPDPESRGLDLDHLKEAMKTKAAAVRDAVGEQPIGIAQQLAVSGLFVWDVVSDAVLAAVRAGEGREGLHGWKRDGLPSHVCPRMCTNCHACGQ
jgi:hypothetical protein